MTKGRARGEDIRKFILGYVEKHPADISKVTAKHFDITRQAVNKHLQKLVAEHALAEAGNTRNRTYKLAPLLEWKHTHKIASGLAEDFVTKGNLMRNLSDYDIAAKKILSEDIYDFFAGGAADEVTLKNNINDFTQIKIIPHVLRNVAEINLTTHLLGHTLTVPFLIAPIGAQKLVHNEGELAVASAASRSNCIMTVPMFSNYSLEEIRAVTTAPLFFQIYFLKDKALLESIIRRAETANYQAIVLTVDAPVSGLRERDQSHNFQFPSTIQFKNLSKENLNNKSITSSESAVARYVDLYDKTITWKDLDWLRSKTKLPIIIKGVLHPDDAKLALDNGVDAIIVSNHGGRQLDNSVSTISILPKIVKVINNKIPILMDGGIRRGIDIFKALAMGADGVLVGRPIIWGLSIDGAEGVISILNLLKLELINAMTLAGFTSISQLKSEGASVLLRERYS